MTTYGTVIEASKWTPRRSVLASPEATVSGNVLLRAGRELAPGEGVGWERTEHIVLTPAEALGLIEELSALVGPPGGGERYAEADEWEMHVNGGAPIPGARWSGTDLVVPAGYVLPQSSCEQG